jgi:hypothetical protein
MGSGGTTTSAIALFAVAGVLVGDEALEEGEPGGGHPPGVRVDAVAL